MYQKQMEVVKVTRRKSIGYQECEISSWSLFFRVGRFHRLVAVERVMWIE
jgi:hypothetical protein